MFKLIQITIYNTPQEQTVLIRCNNYVNRKQIAFLFSSATFINVPKVSKV